MASLEDLPADQRAVLQLVLGRGRTYDEIAALLSIDRSAVRQRALDACDALTPEQIDPGPEQALITDYLLSQLPTQVAEQVYVYLEAAPEEREWADAIAGALAPLASKPLPEIPVAAPLRSDQPTLTEETDEEPANDPAPQPPATVVPLPSSPAPTRTAPPRGEHSAESTAAVAKRRHRILVAALSAATLLVAVIVVVLVAGSGSKSPGTIKPRRIYTYTNPTDTTTTGSGTTATGTTTTAGTQILAALNLSSPVGATQTLGVADVVRVDGVLAIAIDASGVPPNSAHNAYGVWFYNSRTSHRFLGFDTNLVGKNGKFALGGKLPKWAARYKQILITLETHSKPKTPGEVVLSGPFRESSAK